MKHAYALVLASLAVVAVLTPGAVAANQDHASNCTTGTVRLCLYATITAGFGSCSYVGDSKSCTIPYYTDIVATTGVATPSGSASGFETLFGQSVSCSWLADTGCQDYRVAGYAGLFVPVGTCQTSPDDYFNGLSASALGLGSVSVRSLGPVQDTECA